MAEKTVLMLPAEFYLGEEAGVTVGLDANIHHRSINDKCREDEQVFLTVNMDEDGDAFQVELHLPKPRHAEEQVNMIQLKGVEQIQKLINTLTLAQQLASNHLSNVE